MLIAEVFSSVAPSRSVIWPARMFVAPVYVCADSMVSVFAPMRVKPRLLPLMVPAHVPFAAFVMKLAFGAPDVSTPPAPGITPPLLVKLPT